MQQSKHDELNRAVPEHPVKAGVSAGCGCASSCGETAGGTGAAASDTPGQTTKKILQIDLLAINLTSCQRCVPTGEQLKTAVHLLAPVAEALGIELRHRELTVETADQARELSLLSSPTIRLNGRDVVQDIRESHCESCGELTDNGTEVDCREWHYRGEVYFAAPLPLLIEAIMGAMLQIDLPPAPPSALEALAENIQRFFDHKRQSAGCCSAKD